MMRKLLLFLILVSIGVGANAQETPKALTLQECVNIALENNLRIKRSLYNLKSADINLTQSKMAMLPSLNAGTSFGRNFGRALNPVDNDFVNKNSNTANLQGTGSVLVFNGLRLQNTIKQNSKELDATSQDLEKAKNDVMLSVVNNYTNVVFNKELFENANYQLISSQEQLERIKKQVAAGALPVSSQLNQEAQVATNEVNLINQENALNLSFLQLKQSMQLPGSTAFDVVVPAVELEDLVLDNSAEAIYGTAVSTMPEIKSAILRMESSEFALRAAKGNLYPRLNLNGSAQTNYSDLSPFAFSDQVNNNQFKSIGLQLNIPIFNGLQSRSAVQRAAVSKEVSAITKLETENTLRQNIETAYNDALAASKTYTASLKQVQAREEAYRMTRQRFEIGAANYVEYRISENDLFQSKSDLARAKYNFIFRKKLLDFYQGKSIEF
jgi:outer membrane protein